MDSAKTLGPNWHVRSIASLKPSARAKLLSSLTDEQATELRNDWLYRARTEQLPPPENDPWVYWLFLAGRGAGKTRAGAEWIRQCVKDGYKHIAMIAPTQRDARNVMVEGPSGILRVCWPGDKDRLGKSIGRPAYEPSKLRLTWPNGAVASVFSAEEPDRLRGPQHDLLWADELAAWPDVKTTWAMAMFGLRIGTKPRAMISTTPRPIPELRELLRSPFCRVTRATTYANRSNLADTFFSSIIGKYEGTRLGRQELQGDILEEAEGALWNRDIVDACHDGRSAEYKRIVVAVDPATTDKATSNLTGIVVAARALDGRAYVIEDLSGRYSPDQWGKIAVQAYDDWGADRVVAEGNQGGDMVRHTLRTVRDTVPVRIVSASRSKQARAEPVAALYEQRRVTHVHPFPELEDQLCTWEPLSGEPSPDRLDALVWALTDLMLERPNTAAVAAPPFWAGTPRRIPGQ